VLILPTEAIAFATLPEPEMFNYGELTYAYYHKATYSDWVVVFLPGGQGGLGQLYGCGGNLFPSYPPSDFSLQLCWVVNGKLRWLADVYSTVGFDMVQPTTYEFSYSNRGWLTNILQYVKYGLGYRHVILAGFSAGGAAAASAIAWSGSSMSNLIDAAVVYEGPMFSYGGFGPASLAANVTVPTFLVYGDSDGNVSVTNGMDYISHMNPQVPYQLEVLSCGHDDNVIIVSRSDLLLFLSKLD
jgi:hypothetical protein